MILGWSIAQNENFKVDKKGLKQLVILRENIEQILEDFCIKVSTDKVNTTKILSLAKIVYSSVTKDFKKFQSTISQYSHCFLLKLIKDNIAGPKTDEEEKNMHTINLA